MEEIFETVGPWHVKIFLLSLLGHLPYGMFVMSLSFMAPKVEYQCDSWQQASALSESKAPLDGRCLARQGNLTLQCSAWQYDHSIHYHTLVQEWDAVCDRSWMLAMAQSTLMCGMLVGCFVFSHISDWYGRRLTFIVALAVVCVAGSVISFTQSFWVFSALRFVMAMGHGGRRMANTLAIESVGPKHRAIVTVGQDLGWSLGVLVTAIVTFFIRDWVWIQRAIMIPELFFIVLACTLDESPKWLLSACKYEQAKDLLHKIIKQNKLKKSINVDGIIEKAKASLLLEKRTQRGSFIDLLRGKKFLILTMSCWFQYVVAILVYYQMIYYIVDIGSNPYISVVYMGLLEIAITGAAWFILKTFRRKPVYYWSYTLAIISATALLFPAEDSVVLRTVLANIGKLAVMIVYDCLVVHISECFPTKIRSVALGSSQTASRLGAIAAPFLKQLGVNTAPWVPVSLTVVLSAGALCFSVVLPETFGRELPNTFHETERMLREAS